MTRRALLSNLLVAGLAALAVVLGAIGAAQAAGPLDQQAKLTASDGAAGDSFGFSVAVSGDTAVVGDSNAGVGGNLSQGSTYVFVAPPAPTPTPVPGVAAGGLVALAALLGGALLLLRRRRLAL